MLGCTASARDFAAANRSEYDGPETDTVTSIRPREIRGEQCIEATEWAHHWIVVPQPDQAGIRTGRRNVYLQYTKMLTREQR